jgi:hypothetical protein
MDLVHGRKRFTLERIVPILQQVVLNPNDRAEVVNGCRP